MASIAAAATPAAAFGGRSRTSPRMTSPITVSAIASASAASNSQGASGSAGPASR